MKLRRRIGWFVALCTLAIVFGITTWFVRRHIRVQDELEWYARHGKIVQSSLGVSFGTPYVRIDGKVTEVFAIESLDQKSPLRNAGATEGDIIVCAENQIDAMILKWLYERQGQSVRWTLREGGDGPRLEVRPLKSIEFIVPTF